LNEIRKICDHYEAKCEGQYNSLASRYIFQMGQEIKAQLDQLENGSCKHCTGYYLYENPMTMQQHPNIVDNPVNYDSVEGDKVSKTYRGTFRTKLHVLQDALQEAKNELIQYKEKSSQKIESYNSLKKTYVQCNKEVQGLRIALEEEKKKHASEMERMKNDTKRVITFVRKKANEALIDTETKYMGSIKDLNQTLLQRENEYKSHISAHLENLENQISCAVQSEKAAIVKGLYCMDNMSSRVLKSSQVANIKPRSFFPDDTVSTVSDDSPIDSSQENKGCQWSHCRAETLECLADTIMSNVRNGFQSILDGKGHDPDEQRIASPRLKYPREIKRRRPPNIIPP